MRAVGGRPARRSWLWALVRRCWPVGALAAAGAVVLASPGLQVLLTALIWVSWLLVGCCALTSSDRARRLAREVGCRVGAWLREMADRVAGAARAALPVRSRRLRSRMRREVRAQLRRLRSRVRGELRAGERS